MTQVLNAHMNNKKINKKRKKGKDPQFISVLIPQVLLLGGKLLEVHVLCPLDGYELVSYLTALNRCLLWGTFSFPSLLSLSLSLCLLFSLSLAHHFFGFPDYDNSP
jgi:hypothetical protein